MMPFEVMLSELPLEVAIPPARKGEFALVRSAGFVSSEDGDVCLRQLEHLPSTLLGKAVGDRVRPSQVDNLLAIIRRDKSATVYVNELQPELSSGVGSAKQKGDLIFKDDISDITRVDLGVAVPVTAAVVFVFSWGWRKGIFCDFGPLAPQAQPRAFDLPAVLGELYARLIFQERFCLSDDEWVRFFQSGWFPFVGLGSQMLTLVFSRLRAGWDIDELTHTIADEIKSKVPSFLAFWQRQPALAVHANALETAIACFRSGEYSRTTQLQVPRIEEVFQANLKGASANWPGNLLLSSRFEHYLLDVFFPSVGRKPLSGGMPPAFAGCVREEDQAPVRRDISAVKSSAIAILVLHQISRLLERPPQPGTAGSLDEGKPNLQRTVLDAAEAANRWTRWWARGSNLVLGRLIECLDRNLPLGWKRLQGEELKRYRSSVGTAVAFYSLDTTLDHIGVTLSIESTQLGEVRGGWTWFASPPHPATATISAGWNQIMRLLDDGIAAAARSVGAEIHAPDADELFLSELPQEIALALVHFSRSARKSLPLASDDLQRWNAFVVRLFSSTAVIDGQRLVEWFVREGWPRDAAMALETQLSDQYRLLSQYVQEVVSA